MNLGYALFLSGYIDEASTMWERAHAIARELGYAELMWGALVGLASVARNQDDLDRAASLLREARRTRDAAMIFPEPFEGELYEQTRLQVASVLGAESESSDR